MALPKVTGQILEQRSKPRQPNSKIHDLCVDPGWGEGGIDSSGVVWLVGFVLGCFVLVR